MGQDILLLLIIFVLIIVFLYQISAKCQEKRAIFKEHMERSVGYRFGERI